MEGFNQVIGFLNNIIWSPALVYVLLVVGLWFSIRSRFVQLRLIPTMCRLLFANKESDKGISSFQAMCTALAGRIGTGNIAGTALGIFWGGPGAIFWMWVSAFLGASTTYVECSLAQLYKIEVDGQWRGGPACFIEYGMKQKWYANITAVCVLLACGILLPGTQSYAITTGFMPFASTPESQRILTLVVAAIVTGFLGFIIFGGVKRIAHFAEWCVPIMAIVYVVLALVIIFVNIDQVGNVFKMIVVGAFSPKAVLGGVFGTTILWGVKRGIFSNEAGQGSQPHTAAAAEVDHPAKQGLVQAIGVYIDTWFVCSATAFIILMTDTFNMGIKDAAGNLSYLHIGSAAGQAEYAAANIYGGAEFTQNAVNNFMPGFGNWFVAICLAFFAFTTILSYYYQAEANIAYMFRNSTGKNRQIVTLLLRLFMMLMTFIMATNKVDAVWDSADLGVGLTAWLNLIAIVILQNAAFVALKDYEKQRKELKSDYAPWWDPRKDKNAKACNADVWATVNSDKLSA